jgi:hypothetical protein
LRDAEQLDRDLGSVGSPSIASEAFLPVETIMGTSRARKQGRRRGEGRCSRGLQVDLHSLVTHQLQARLPMISTTPVTPEKRRISDRERMQEDTHLARLGRGVAIPLTLLAQRTGAATANAGSIHHAQAAIGFSALLMREQLLGSRATQRAIGLEGKVLPREAARFPGQAHLRRCIARGGRRVR